MTHKCSVAVNAFANELGAKFGEKPTADQARLLQYFRELETGQQPTQLALFSYILSRAPVRLGFLLEISRFMTAVLEDWRPAVSIASTKAPPLSDALANNLNSLMKVAAPNKVADEAAEDNRPKELFLDAKYCAECYADGPLEVPLLHWAIAANFMSTARAVGVLINILNGNPAEAIPSRPPGWVAQPLQSTDAEVDQPKLTAAAETKTPNSTGVSGERKLPEQRSLLPDFTNPAPLLANLKLTKIISAKDAQDELDTAAVFICDLPVKDDQEFEFRAHLLRSYVRASKGRVRIDGYIIQEFANLCGLSHVRLAVQTDIWRYALSLEELLGTEVKNVSSAVRLKHGAQIGAVVMKCVPPWCPKYEYLVDLRIKAHFINFWNSIPLSHKGLKKPRLVNFGNIDFDDFSRCRNFWNQNVHQLAEVVHQPFFSSTELDRRFMAEATQDWSQLVANSEVRRYLLRLQELIRALEILEKQEKEEKNSFVDAKPAEMLHQ